MKEILERQLLIRAFATYSTIEKALAGRKESFRGPHAARAGLTIRQTAARSLSLLGALRLNIKTLRYWLFIFRAY